jgi:hypothetical protein
VSKAKPRLKWKAWDSGGVAEVAVGSLQGRVTRDYTFRRKAWWIRWRTEGLCSIVLALFHPGRDKSLDAALVAAERLLTEHLSPIVEALGGTLPKEGA